MQLSVVLMEPAGAQTALIQEKDLKACFFKTKRLRN